MKYTLRNYIENLEDRVVNKDIYIKDDHVGMYQNVFDLPVQ